jgi:hypothetical protein
MSDKILPESAPNAPRFESIQAFKSINELVTNARVLRQYSLWIKGKAENVGEFELNASETLRFALSNYDHIVVDAYGEEKHILNLSNSLYSLSKRVRAIESSDDKILDDWGQPYTLDDLIFLNEFLLWYFYPQVEPFLSDNQVSAIRYTWSADSQFQMEQANLLHFTFDGAPIDEFGMYLGLID